MKIVYCKEWSLFYKKPLEIWDTDTALKCHNIGKSYSVLIYEEDILTNVIGLDKDGAVVRFYDKDMNVFLLYGFCRKDNNKLFLNGAYHYLYKDGTKIEQTIFNFKDTGELFIERRNIEANSVEEKEAIVDISSNWEEYPEFGNYCSLIRVER